MPDRYEILVGSGEAGKYLAWLEKLGVDVDPRGYIQVNEKLETTAPGVWALGDCAGTPQSTHAAYDDFRVVSDNLLGSSRSRTTRGRLIPSCMFTDPELVRVGLNEKQARQLGIPYRIARMAASAVLRTRTISEPRGFLKMPLLLTPIIFWVLLRFARKRANCFLPCRRQWLATCPTRLSATRSIHTRQCRKASSSCLPTYRARSTTSLK